MNKVKTQLAVLGGGPGGYTSAFRAADLGLEVTIIEKEDSLGGVCLNMGCIPSKTLLHAAEIIREAKSAEKMGILFQAPDIDYKKLREYRFSVVQRLQKGLSQLTKARGIQIIKGTGKFTGGKSIQVKTDTEEAVDVEFEKCIIAAGSRAAVIPGFPEDPGIWDSTDALDMGYIPESLLIVGGGVIGLEMAAVYHELGTRITIVEMAERIIPEADKDLTDILLRTVRKRYEGIYTSSKVTGIRKTGRNFEVSIEGPKSPENVSVERVLIATGRVPNSDLVGLENTDAELDKKGFIITDHRMRTSSEGIYAIGDIKGAPMLAHKASAEGKVAAEDAAGIKTAFTPMTIPSVAYTDPQVAWMGLTEKAVSDSDIKYEIGKFPWSASGRALSEDSVNGLTKLIFDKETKRIAGAGITGKNAGELLAETVLALEMGADYEDIGKTIHAHPTLSETVSMAAEMTGGTITELIPEK